MQLTISAIVLSIFTAAAGVVHGSPLEARQVLCTTDADCDLGLVCTPVLDTGLDVSLLHLPHVLSHQCSMWRHVIQICAPALSTLALPTLALPTITVDPPTISTAITVSVALPTVTL